MGVAHGRGPGCAPVMGGGREEGGIRTHVFGGNRKLSSMKWR